MSKTTTKAKKPADQAPSMHIANCSFNATAAAPTPAVIEAVKAIAAAAEANAYALAQCAEALKSVPGTTAPLLSVGA